MKANLVLDLARAQRETGRTLNATKASIVAGIKEGTTVAKASLRAELASAFHSLRLQNTWQSKQFGEESFHPAGFIFSKAPEIIEAFSRGVEIRANGHAFLAVPTPAAPKTGTDGKALHLGKEAGDYGNFPVGKYGPLRYVKASERAGGVGLLVVDNIRVGKGGVGKRRAVDSSIAKGKVASVVMFWLVPSVRLKKRIDPDAIMRAAAAALPGRVLSNLKDPNA